VNQNDCYHYFAPSVRDGNKYVGMDLWFTMDDLQLPCKITLTDSSSNPPLQINYAFDGMTAFIPPDQLSKCQISRSSCVEDNYVCHVKKKTQTKLLSLML